LIETHKSLVKIIFYEVRECGGIAGLNDIFLCPDDTLNENFGGKKLNKRYRWV
jgi:hypothetical protein